MSFFSSGLVVVSSGKCNGRSVHDMLIKGRITITGIDEEEKPFQRVLQFREGEIFDNKLKVKGRTVHHIVYGAFETIQGEEGREIIRFHKGTGRGKHGKSRRCENLFGHRGVCHSWYKNGRLVRQKFIFDNKRLCYDYNGYARSCTVRDYEGTVLYELNGVLDGRMSAYYGGHSIFQKPMRSWFTESQPFEIRRNGKVIYKGQVSNGQRTGEWVEDGKKIYYEHGVAIPKALYDTPAEKLNPLKVLGLNNAQLRMALMAKIGTERIVKAGKVIHKDGEMRLYNIPKFDVRILRVRCPTTKSFYYLRVPKDATKCEEARQWTFHVGDGIQGPIKFAVET